MISSVIARRPVGRLGLVVLALLSLFMAILVNGLPPETWASITRRGERPVAGGIRGQLVDAQQNHSHSGSYRNAQNNFNRKRHCQDK